MKNQILLVTMVLNHFLAGGVSAAHKPALVHDVREARPPLAPPKGLAARKAAALAARLQAEKPHKDKEVKKQDKVERKEAKEHIKEERKEQVHAKKDEVKLHVPIPTHPQKLVEEKKLKEQRHLTGFSFPSFGSFPKMSGFGGFGMSKAWSINDQNMGQANTLTAGKGTSSLTINNEGTSAGAKADKNSMAGGNFMNMHNSWSKDLVAQSAFPATASSGVAQPAASSVGFGFPDPKAAFPGFGMKSAWMKTAQTMADSQSMAMGSGSAEIKAGKAGVTAAADGTDGTMNQGSFANKLEAWSDEGASHIAPADDKQIPAELPFNVALLGSNQDVPIPAQAQQVALGVPQAADPQLAVPQQGPGLAAPQAVPQQADPQVMPQQIPQQVPEQAAQQVHHQVPQQGPQ